ncbi:hypothetical protein INR49_006440 [Caranx melampygus]|nr:hypothetical protein INR49_006440 [Caranx melampygus]
MAAGDTKILWSFMLLLAGSTVTLPCTFTPQSVRDGKPVSVKIIRVVWCKGHEICQGTTPSVFDSESTTNKPIDHRYGYLGDKQGNCTLQITDVQNKDQGTFRFRMEAEDGVGHWTERKGVVVTVAGAVQLRVSSSSGEREREGHTVTLLCSSSVCTIHRLELTWFRGDHALSESGPALQLGPLTTQDSGNYSCALKSNPRSRSAAYLLQVEAGGGSVLPTAVAVSCVLAALAALILFIFIFIRRRRAAAESNVGGGEEQSHPDNIYSDVLPAAEQGAEPQDDVSYAAVLFTHRNQARPVVGEEDTIIYSSVATRG